jgi:hypothetical protein
VGEEPNHTTTRKPGPLYSIHSILSAYNIHNTYNMLIFISFNAMGDPAIGKTSVVRGIITGHKERWIPASTIVTNDRYYRLGFGSVKLFHFGMQLKTIGSTKTSCILQSSNDLSGIRSLHAGEYRYSLGAFGGQFNDLGASTRVLEAFSQRRREHL